MPFDRGRRDFADGGRVWNLGGARAVVLDDPIAPLQVQALKETAGSLGVTLQTHASGQATTFRWLRC
jgi:hypothetical protein